MKSKYLLFRRNSVYYSEDTTTGKQISLRTRDETEARALIHSKNESFRQPVLNLQIARTYLAATDPEIAKRTWQVAMDEMENTKTGPTLVRHRQAMKDKAFDLIRNLSILETQAVQFLKVLETGSISTNVFLRRLHHFALNLNWLPWPVLAKSQWPEIRFGEKRAITVSEHQAIIENECNAERKAFYQFCWHLGGAQSDIANLTAESFDLQNKLVSFYRLKTKTLSTIRFGNELETLLQSLPKSGPLFPTLQKRNESRRGSAFKRRCERLGIAGVTLHSYRYAWAERAKTCGYPERFAQEALGHNSKAVHRAYARNAQVVIPTLEDYERKIAANDNAVTASPVMKAA